LWVAENIWSLFERKASPVELKLSMNLFFVLSIAAAVGYEAEDLKSVTHD
jgi:hypothetical protein